VLLHAADAMVLGLMHVAHFVLTAGRVGLFAEFFGPPAYWRVHGFHRLHRFHRFHRKLFGYWLAGPIPKLKPTYATISQKYIAKENRIGDPTRLILVDEADRLKIVSLEQMQAERT
jgi:hypothetical protein